MENWRRRRWDVASDIAAVGFDQIAVLGFLRYRLRDAGETQDIIPIARTNVPHTATRPAPPIYRHRV